jgi:predicted HTH transcriptional regulator
MFSINNLSQYRENNLIEVKKAGNKLPSSIWSTYSAFANTNGGTILLGVDENADKSFNIVGLDNPEKLVADFWNVVHSRNKVNVNLLSNNDVEIIDIDGKQIIKIEIPRASRTKRPIYLDNHPENTYRRNGEGDYRCSKEEYIAMLRDNDFKTQDMLVLEKLDNSVFNFDTVKAYRNRMQITRPDHVWESLPHDEFLFMLGAIDVGEDNQRHPTAAGLLMFGNDYEIVREYGGYFLDYQEQLDADIRWTDRVNSSTGEWSGNICDFYFKVVNRLGQTLKVPFKLVGDTRIDDTPVHKAVREAVVNCLVNADYYGRCGLVIKRKPKELTLENPGGFRIPIDLALSGGLSDPRNSVLMKMFSLLNIGERAGSGIPNILNVWKKEKLGVPKYEEIMHGSRTKLTLPIEYLENNSQGTSEVSSQVSSEVSSEVIFNKIIDFCKTERSKKEICEFLKLSNSTYFTKKYLNPLIESGKLELTIPDKPNSQNQKYRAC